MTSFTTPRILFVIAMLTALRGALATVLPLSFDEAYFWLWSKHLAISYYDHPPMIALAIRLGTLIFGDVEFGVRFVPMLASVAASWAVWRAAALLLSNDLAAGLACCLFNLMLMVAAESMSATPDALVLAAAAFLLWAMAELQDSQDGRWWCAVGLVVGAALFTKYTAFFLGAGVVLWLGATPRGRAWLRTPWPYAGAVLATACFVPTLLWNASHDWISFKFQFGRVVEGSATLRYFAEFAAGQLALASPFILVLGAVGLARETRLSPATRPLAFAAAMIWPALIYFLIHALHDRVQANWPSFVYPALAILAAVVMVTPGDRSGIESILRPARALAAPVAASILVIAYLQAFTGVLPMGLADPISRMTATGLQPVAERISALVHDSGDVGIVTTKYATASWLAFYVRPHAPVIEITEDYRWLAAPQAALGMLQKPLLYVTQAPAHELPLIAGHFSRIAFVVALPRTRNGVVIDRFYVFAVSGFHGRPLGRVPNA